MRAELYNNMKIELYNENTGEYKYIEAATITREADNRYIYSGFGMQPLAVFPNSTMIMFNEDGNEIGNILLSETLDGIKVKIDKEIWQVVSIGDYAFFTPKIPEEHTNDKWLELLKD